MTINEEIKTTIGKEIKQAKVSSLLYKFLHFLLASSTIIAGAATTYVTGTHVEAPNWLAPLLAALTTGLGAIANQTNFKKKSNGYRLTKTEFQNLELELLKENSKYKEDAALERIKQLRNQKIARTTDEG